MWWPFNNNANPLWPFPTANTNAKKVQGIGINIIILKKK